MNICDYSDEGILVKAFLKPDEEIIDGEAVCLEKELQKDNWVVTNIFWLFLCHLYPHYQPVVRLWLYNRLSNCSSVIARSLNGISRKALSPS
jgi:hypothetical protein